LDQNRSDATDTSQADRKKQLGKRLDEIGWGLFFIWVGIAVLLDVGWGIGLLGVGILALLEQAIRKVKGLAVEGFWVVVGALLVVGGGWELAESRLWLIAVILIIAGVAMLISAAKGGSERVADEP
jgi:hypothetical protein